MIFPYKYAIHSLDKLHKYIEHLVLDVWCKADKNTKFDILMLHKDFKPVVVAVSKNKNDYLLKPIQEIYILFSKLDTADKTKLSNGFRANNDIKGLCIGKSKPLRYDDIKAFSEPLAIALNPFFKNLYTKLLGIKIVKTECGDLNERYKEFMVSNSKGKCPFCGLEDIKSEKLRVRDAYDHYLPKDIYPFNSINFKNLVPACHTCNSSYKLVKDPIHSSSKKMPRRAFYPFGKTIPEYNLNVRIKSIDFKNPKKNALSVSFNSTSSMEEVNSWLDVYGIKERYEDKCSSDDAIEWIKRLMDDRLNYADFDIKKYMNARKIELKNTPHIEYRFLRVPFLEAYIQYTGFASITTSKS